MNWKVLAAYSSVVLVSLAYAGALIASAVLSHKNFLMGILVMAAVMLSFAVLEKKTVAWGRKVIAQDRRHRRPIKNRRRIGMGMPR